jgi:hypothetical protein
MIRNGHDQGNSMGGLRAPSETATVGTEMKPQVRQNFREDLSPCDKAG